MVLRENEENFTLKIRVYRQHFMIRPAQPHVVYIVYLTTALKTDLMYLCVN